jgi:hypothetical protein
VDDGPDVSDVVAHSSIEEVTARLLDAKHALGLDRVYGQIQPAFQRRALVGLEGWRGALDRRHAADGVRPAPSPT